MDESRLAPSHLLLSRIPVTNMSPILSAPSTSPSEATSHLVKPQSAEMGMTAFADNFSSSCKKIVRYLWDPEPKNDDVNEPIWCLGREYSSREDQGATELSCEEPQEFTAVDALSSDTQDRSATTTTTTSTTAAPAPATTTATASAEPAQGLAPWPPAFLLDVESRAWMTYRSDFPAIPHYHKASSTVAGGSDTTHESRSRSNHSPSLSLNVRLRNAFSKSSGFASDTGWGCMIRSGQMVLANTLYILAFGRDWRHDRNSPSLKEAEILQLFADDPNAPFSIHKFVEYGTQKCGMFVGEWFGPSTTARCIGALIQGYNAACKGGTIDANAITEPNFDVYVSPEGGDVCEARFCEIAKRRKVAINNNENQPVMATTDASASPENAQATEHFTPMLILLGTRLGLDAINPSYFEALKRTLRMKQAVGIAGGRPSSSHYFMGAQGMNLFFLDPHQTRPAISWPEANNTAKNTTSSTISSHHTRRLRRMHIKDIDPSMLIGFFIRDWEDWEDFKTQLARDNEEVEKMGGKAVVTLIGDGESVGSDPTTASTTGSPEMEMSPSANINGNANGQRPSPYEREEAVDEVVSLADEDEWDH